MFSKEIFAQRVKTLRIKKNIKQSELGKIVGLSDNAISDINLADYFGVSVDYLMGRADNPEVNR